MWLTESEGVHPVASHPWVMLVLVSLQPKKQAPKKSHHVASLDRNPPASFGRALAQWPGVGLVETSNLWFIWEMGELTKSCRNWGLTNSPIPYRKQVVFGDLFCWAAFCVIPRKSISRWESGPNCGTERAIGNNNAVGILSRDSFKGLDLC